jgi:hypothetical protein
MMWNFDGVGLFRPENRYFQCEAKRLDSPYPYIGDHPDYTQCSGAASWPDYTERRIYEAREAVRSIANQMNDDERMRVIAFSSEVKDVSAEWFDNSGELSNGENVENHIIEIGQCGALYRSCGGTAGPIAMDRAKELITSGDFPFEEDEFGGALLDKPLRPVVIYMTDGVANKMRYTGDSSDGNPACSTLSNTINTAFCQIGEDSSGRTLPISSMQEITREMKDAMESRGEDDFILYVLAMGRLDLTGLDRVASGGVDTLFAARSADEVQALLSEIKNEVSAGVCTVEMKEDARRVTASNQPENRRALVNPRAEDEAIYGDDIYGYVTITGNNIDPIYLPIHHNDEGRLVVEMEQENGLVPGEYTMDAWAWYNASGETGDTRLYDRLYDLNTGQKVESISFTITPMLGSHFRLPDIRLDLRDDIVLGMCQ